MIYKNQTIHHKNALKHSPQFNINDYLVDENGFFLSKGGGLVTELQLNGQNAQSGQFLIDDVFNQEISGDLTQNICPPFDSISETLQEKLYKIFKVTISNG